MLVPDHLCLAIRFRISILQGTAQPQYSSGSISPGSPMAVLTSLTNPHQCVEMTGRGIVVEIAVAPGSYRVSLCRAKSSRSHDIVLIACRHPRDPPSTPPSNPPPPSTSP